MPESTSARAALQAWLATGRPPVPVDSAAAHALAAAAAEQGLAGLLHEAVRDDVRWPPPARTGLREVRQVLLRRGTWQLDLAERARLALERRGLRALPLKGAALAERLYTSPADRPMADADLLALDSWPGSLEALRREGFEPREHADHAVVLRDAPSGLVLELHRGLTSCPRLHPVDSEGWWARSRRVAGQVGRVPSPEDLLVQLGLHAAFQHGLVLSLVQWLDLRRLLEREELSPARLAAAAATAHAAVALAAALETARVVVGAAYPDVLRAVLPRLPARLRRWLDGRRAAPLAFVTPAPPPLARLRWELSAGRRARLVLDTLLPADTLTAEPGGRARALARTAARAAHLGRHWLLPRAARR